MHSVHNVSIRLVQLYNHLNLLDGSDALGETSVDIDMDSEEDWTEGPSADETGG